VDGIRDVDGQPEFGGGAGQVLVEAGGRVGRESRRQGLAEL
jgi:hypothetical protein